MSREYLIIVPEASDATWGTYPVSPSYNYIQLTDSNQFSMRPLPMSWEIRSASGYNRRILRGSGLLPGGAANTAKLGFTGNLNNLVVFGSQATLWQTMLTPVALGGQGGYYMPSYSIDHVISGEDSGYTAIVKRYLGCRVSTATFTASADSQLLRLSLGLVAKNYTAAAASDGGITSYPFDPPFVLEHATAFVLGSTGSRSEFDSFSCTISNVLDATFFNQTRITRLRYCGRSVDGNITFPYTVTADRADLENVTKSTASVAFSITTPVAHSLTFTFQNVNYTVGIADSLDYNRVFLQALNFSNYVDTTVPNDLVLTAS